MYRRWTVIEIVGYNWEEKGRVKHCYDYPGDKLSGRLLKEYAGKLDIEIFTGIVVRGVRAAALQETPA